MVKAIVITSSGKKYDHFIKGRKLNRNEYPMVSSPDKLYGYKDVPAFVLADGNDIVFATGSYSYQHNIDLIAFPI